MKPADLIEAAVAASSLADAHALRDAIIGEIGAEHRRPVADKANNYGLLSGAGSSYDHKIIENVTNMQDAVIEREAAVKFGDLTAVPYRSPREAVANLFNGTDLSSDVVVEFRDSDPPASVSKRITAIFRDHGCGRTAEQIPGTIFGGGSSHKVAFDWMQGSFGLGGETTYRNAEAVILVTRRHPDILRSWEDDRVVVTVVEWVPHGANRSAQYLVTSRWEKPGDNALPFSVPASRCPDFEPGTHLALVSYGVEGFHRARGGGDERAFEAVLNTRLFQPVTPVTFKNRVLKDRAREADVLRGLAKRLDDNPREDRKTGQEVLPYTAGGKTYHLPINFYVFARPGEKGERRNFVARDHAVIFTSNGQVHYHWDPQQFRYKTKLSKLHDRILVVVQTDELPISVRNSLFTPDRQQLVRNDPAVRLENEVAGFLDEWDELKQINGELIREAITSHHDSRPTINIARQISRALTIRGFSLSQPDEKRGDDTGGTGRRRTRRVIDLYPDPTALEGPEHVTAEEGKTKYLTYIINAENDFIPRRGTVQIECDHPDIGQREITIGSLRNGRMRVSIAVPAAAAKGVFTVKAVLAGWSRSSGGIGATLEWQTSFEVVEERERDASSRNTASESRKDGSAEGNLVAIVWKAHEEHQSWDKMTVGDVELVPARQLAEERTEYAELSRLGEKPIPTLILNSHYVGLKRYLDGRARTLSAMRLEQKKDQYAVGVGVGLCLTHLEVEKRRKLNEPIPEDWLSSTKEALARSVLSMMPAFDELAREAGLDEA